jgi:endonuclease/exonuclease/phosphatase (EEP) superfamily protein YafD
MHASRTTPWVRLGLEGIGSALLAAGAGAVAFYAIPSLQLLNRVTVMASAFIPYGLPAFAGAAVIFATVHRRRLRPLAVAAVAGAVLLAWWAKPYWPAPAPASGGNSLTLLTMNLRCNHSGTSDLAALAQRAGPDVVVVQGFDSTQRSALGDAWSQALPHSTFHPMARQSGCGTLVASRTPLRTLSAPEDAQPVVEVDLPSGSVVLLPVDLPTPTNGLTPWLDAFAHLSEAVRAHRDRPLVVAGDFNAVREHEPLRRLLQDTGLRDAAEVAGAGWTPTFPSRPWHPPLLGLDHVLIGAPQGASEVRTEAIVGQEHRSLIVRIEDA